MWLQTLTTLPSLRQFLAGQSDAPKALAHVSGGGGCRNHTAWQPRQSAIRKLQTCMCASSAQSSSAAPDYQLGTQQQQPLRVLAVTDLHVDYAENMRWCADIDDTAYRHDVLVVSGDVCDELGALEEALGMLADKFAHVFYTPGNHELWIREKDRACGVNDSLTKLRLVMELCQKLGVHTQPRQLGDLWVVPLLSWHHRSFDTDPDIPGVPPVSAWTVADYSACKWPHSVPGGSSQGSLELARWFDDMNDMPAWRALLSSRAHCDVVSFSHFLPHQVLLPEKRYLFYPNLAKAVGSAPLAARLDLLRPDIHLFGHTHFAWDARLGGTRYLQAPLCSPAERQRRLFTVGFDATMAAAQADPVAARWLPLLVYQGLPPAAGVVLAGRQHQEQQRADGGEQQQQGQQQAAVRQELEAGAVQAVQAAAAAAATAAAVAARGLADWQVQQQPAAVAAAADGGGQLEAAAGDSNGGSITTCQQPAVDSLQHAAVAAPRQQQEQQQQRDKLLQAWEQQGWQALRHGVAPPPLHAHWSDHYAKTARQPDIVVMAPWVGKLYEKRRARAARAGSSSSSGGADGSISSADSSMDSSSEAEEGGE